MGQVLSLATRHLRFEDQGPFLLKAAQLYTSIVLQRPSLPSPFGSFSTVSDFSDSEDTNSSAASSPVNTTLSSSAEWTARSLVALPAKPELTRARQRAAVDNQGNERRPRSREAVATVHERMVTAPAQMSPQPATDPPPVEVSAHEDLFKEHLFALIMQGQTQVVTVKEEMERAREQDKAEADERHRQVELELERIHRELEVTIKIEDLLTWGNHYGRTDGPAEDVPDSVIRNTVVLAAADKSVQADGKQIFLASDEA